MTAIALLIEDKAQPGKREKVTFEPDMLRIREVDPSQKSKSRHSGRLSEVRIDPALAYWRLDASFFNFFASFFSFGVFKGSFFTDFLLSWLLLMLVAP